MLGNERELIDSDTPAHSRPLDQHRWPRSVSGTTERRWRWAFGAAFLVSLIILFIPESGVPPAIPGTDKVIHLTLFAALTTTGLLAGSRRRWLLPAVLAYAVASEFIQAIGVIGRTSSVADVLADAIGVALGVGLVGWLRRRRAG